MIITTTTTTPTCQTCRGRTSEPANKYDVIIIYNRNANNHNVFVIYCSIGCHTFVAAHIISLVYVSSFVVFVIVLLLLE